jgi:3-oxoacyl-[acyl-carrier protein] reductase
VSGTDTGAGIGTKVGTDTESAPGAAGTGPGREPEEEGRVVLVTGGSRGIGLACAQWFLSRGDRVAVTSRSGSVEGDTGPDAGHLLSLACDVTDPAQVNAAFEAIEEQWGPVEILVANAGVTRDTLVLRMSEEAWSEVIDTNLTGVFRVTKRALAKMIRLHRGRVIMVSSVGAYIGSAGQANYAASKAGLIGMARSMAREVASRSITVNVVAPGLVETNMLAALGDDRRSEFEGQVPLGRVARPDEIAGAVGFLASSEAGYITGAVLPVDGGLGMGL